MKITIVGAGFGGVKAALELAKDSRNEIQVITDKRDFQYYPALYGTATGSSHLESWVPLGQIFAGLKNVYVSIDTVTKIDKDAKTLTGASGYVYTYQTCILALGAVTTYFGIEGLDTYAYGIKSEAEINRLKQHLYSDIAERGTIDKEYIVVGGGPTGVELAAALGTYIKHLCSRYNVKDSHIKVSLVEASPRVLPRMSERASRKVQTRLLKLGVRLYLNKRVESASSDDLVVSGKSLKTKTIIWTSGVANNPFYSTNAHAFNLLPNGRVVVDEYMKSSESIYVIGDNAATTYSGLAQTALHDALFVARNIKRLQDDTAPKKYKAMQPPVVVPVGEGWSVFEYKGFVLTGIPASLIRRAADFIGYSDILSFGQTLGVWHASMIREEDYFTPSAIPADMKKGKKTTSLVRSSKTNKLPRTALKKRSRA